MMTRKDYIATANILSTVSETVSPEIHSELIERFSAMFANDNPRFDRSRFAKASKGEK